MTLVKFIELEKTLKELDKKALEAKKIKACLFNLVIDAEKTERLQYYQKVLTELIDQFPCRIFLIHFDKLATNYSALISQLCPKSSPELLCDLIEITLRPEEYPRLFSLLEANFVNDLPIYYLPSEHGDHLSRFSYKMAEKSNRVICDSTDVVDLDLFIQTMQEFKKYQIEVSDLNWARIESWREMIAKNLNEELLNQLSYIEISYNHIQTGAKQYPFQALLLKGFIARRLEKYFKTNIKITLKQESSPAIWEGAILGCSFFDNKGTKQTFSRHLENPQEAIIHFESPTICYMPQYIQFTKTSPGQSLIKEIRHAAISSDYQEIIANIRCYL